MPNYKTHLAGGSIAFAITLLCVVPHYQPSAITMAEWLLFALAGSLFPDIDIKSKGQRYFYWIILLLLILLSIKKKFGLLTITSIIAVFPLLVKHRGIFHRLWFVVGAPLCIWYLASLQFPALQTGLRLDVFFFITGAVSHLWLDFGLLKMACQLKPTTLKLRRPGPR